MSRWRRPQLEAPRLLDSVRSDGSVFGERDLDSLAGSVEGDAALVWGGAPYAMRLSAATALGLTLAAWHGGLVILKRLPGVLVHASLGYLGRLLIYDLGPEHAPQWWTAKLLLCPSLMVHLDLFGVAADASRALMAYAAHALPWAPWGC